MNFSEDYTSLVNKELSRLVFPDQPKTLYEPQKYILDSPGKRVRPVLTLIACGLCGTRHDRALPAAVAVELLHNFTLIHDDIMDQADSRRGRASIHKKWNLPTAILSGDGMFVQACLQLLKLHDVVDIREANALFLEGVNKICEGQAMDMEFETRDIVSSDEYLKMIEGKTAALLSVSLRLGGMTAGCDTVQLQHLDELGKSIGLAFQIQDDLLDVTANPETFGKEWAGDIYEGKKTFLTVAALESCSAEEKSWLIDVLKLPDHQKDQKLIEGIIQLYEKYGIMDRTEEMIQNYYQTAESSLALFDDSTYKEDLIHFISFLKNREH
ncbi:MAG TPA: polyprenyl synthetase family protein [Balneolaceae bacterium]|nr:polyprenyl synthetase family protein [Balneolaceae bacterium]